MLIAAFLSRYTTSPQLGHNHSLSDRVRSLLMYPQVLCSLLLGSKRPIVSTFLPRQSALYVTNWRNIPHPASLIERASLWFLTMLATAKSSSTMVSYRLVIASDALCKKSLRWLAIFSWSRATFLLAFCRFLLPFFSWLPGVAALSAGRWIG